MQVSVENTSHLGRKLSISVPAAELQKQIDLKLQELTKTIKLDGFRPGKVPLKVIKDRYETAVREEVIGKMIQTSLFDAINEKSLRPVGRPHIESLTAEPGHPLEYVATFDVFPEISLDTLSELVVEKIQTSLEENDINETIDGIRKQHMNWDDVARSAQNQDRLVVDFEGMMDDKVFPGGSAKNVSIVIGSQSFIPGFEEGLIGVTTGAEKTLTLTFPENYHAKDIAGKPVKFNIKVHKIQEGTLPELNEELVKKLGIKDGDLNKFREQVKEHMQRELNIAINNKQKHQLFNKLDKAIQVELPQTLIDQEIHAIIHPHHKHDDVDHHHAMDEINEASEAVKTEAKHRITIGLIVAEVIKKFNIKADPTKVRERIEMIARSYEDPEQLLAFYYSKKENLAGIEALVLEDQVVEKIMQEAKLVDKVMSYRDVMKPDTHN